jgi:hypothetical protein
VPPGGGWERPPRASRSVARALAILSKQQVEPEHITPGECFCFPRRLSWPLTTPAPPIALMMNSVGSCPYFAGGHYLLPARIAETLRKDPRRNLPAIFFRTYCAPGSGQGPYCKDQVPFRRPAACGKRSAGRQQRGAAREGRMMDLLSVRWIHLHVLTSIPHQGVEAVRGVLVISAEAGIRHSRRPCGVALGLSTSLGLQ